MPTKQLTPAALNAAIAEMREKKPDHSPIESQSYLPRREWRDSEGGEWKNIRKDGETVWLPRHDYTGSMDAAIVLFRELPERSLDTIHDENGNELIEAAAFLREKMGYERSLSAEEPIGREAIAICRAWYRWKTGEEIEIVEEN